MTCQQMKMLEKSSILEEQPYLSQALNILINANMSYSLEFPKSSAVINSSKNSQKISKLSMFQKLGPKRMFLLMLSFMET